MEKSPIFKKRNSTRNIHRKDNFSKEKFKLTFPLVLAFAAVQLIILFIIGSFLFNKIFSPKSIAKLLPAETTLGFIEIAIDKNSDQFKQLFDKLKGYPVYNQENLQKLLSLYVSDLGEIEKWIGRKVGLAFIGNSPLAFVEFKNYDEALKYLKSKVLKEIPDQIIEEEFQGQKLISFKLGLYYQVLVVDNYFIITDQSEVINQIALVKNKKIPSLNADRIFSKATQALPKNNLAFAYLNSVKAIPVLMQNKDLTGIKGQYLSGVLPFMKIFSAEAFSLIFDEDKLKLYQTTVIDKTKIGSIPYLKFEKKYSAKLLSLFPDPSLIFIAGRNLNQEYHRLSQLFGLTSQTSQLLFQGLIEEQKNKYFEEKIHTENDLLTLFEGEYAFRMSGQLTKPQWTFILELSNSSDAEVKIQKLKTSFIKKAAQWAPKVEDFTLPDGTKGKEVIANSALITEEKLDYKGQEIYKVNLDTENKNFYYGVVGDKLIISSALGDMQKIIANISAKAEASNQLLKQLNYPDEIITLDINGLIDEKFPLKNYFQPFEKLKIGRSYFDDGIATTFNLEFKKAL